MFKLTFYHFFLSIICMFLFLKGYFPIQKSVVKIIDPPDKLYSHKFNVTQLYRPSIDRLVLIIIDALREDFITDENMPYSYKEKDCTMTVKVEAPTVTLPRIKALTTGGIPQFIDIILNLGDVTKLDDSFLHRAQAANKKIVFYGDNTWIKLFPDIFIRQDGTTSFFVNDFQEVDDNVTRHIDEELVNTDWDIMILHYLGLDHIGHVMGPFSDRIKPKLLEMDEIVQRIHKASKTWNLKTLLLITGDHGMKDSGGHGGTTHAESHVPLISFGKPCSEQTTIMQSDIPTTLSILFGIQIPASSVGKIITNFFKSYDIQRILYLMYYNLSVLSRDKEKCREITKMHYETLKMHTVNDNLIGSYETCLNQLSFDLIQTSVEQNLNLLVISLLASVFLIITILDFRSKFSLRKILPTMVIIPSFIFHGNILMFVTISTVILTSTLFYIRKVIKNFNKIYYIPMFLHVALMLSSSFIEEEHQIWYFYTGTVSLLLGYVLLKNSLTDSIIASSIIFLLRFIRTINSTGDQWASYPDLADWLLSPENSLILKIFYVFSLVLLISSVIKVIEPSVVENVLMVSILFATYVFKMHLLKETRLAQFIWFAILIALVKQLFNDKSTADKIAMIWILIVSLLIKPYNAILIPVCIFGSHINSKYVKNVQFLTLIQLWFGWTLFFCQGHSNSLASIDLGPAYTGLNSYVPILVFIFTICHTYAFPILTLLLVLRENLANADEILTLNIVNRLLALVMICAVVFIQRGHLFVWSVFAPKLLIEAVHTTVLFIFCSCYMLKYCKVNK